MDNKESKNKKNLVFSVFNNGDYIPKEEQFRVFTKLFRSSLNKSKDIEGTGLGLYIVKQIVENSGGKVWFESIKEKGNTFLLHFL